MSSIQDRIQKFNETLENVKWNRDLAKLIQDYLNRQNYSPQAIDNLLMAITKLVETNLKDAVKIFTRFEVPSNSDHGINLLNYAKTRDFIPEPSRRDSIYYLIYWYIGKARNISHHIFTDFSLPDLLMIVSNTNYILNEIDRLSVRHEYYDAKRSFEYDPPSYKISFEVEDIRKDGKPVVANYLEALLVAPDKSVKTVPLNNEGSYWRTNVNAYDYKQGTYMIHLAGLSQDNKRFNISGGTLLVVTSSDYNQNV